ncbi:MAG TPA: aminotransferase class I/II-fold pyridoxal phosphate-dependent enzyme, partial [Candidatus Dormibacteraeota bacterium]
LADRAHGAATLDAVRRGRVALTTALRDLGVEVTEAAANYVCADVRDARRFTALMAAEGIAVRDCTDLGLPRWVRLAVPPPAELERVVEALSRAAFS